jgi:hypothetical protein
MKEINEQDNQSKQINKTRNIPVLNQLSILLLLNLSSLNGIQFSQHHKDHNVSTSSS